MRWGSCYSSRTLRWAGAGETFYRAMVFMVVASPCALVASIMPAALSLISNGARNGMLVKGSVFLEQLGSVQMIAFDKTGTVTKGKPAVETIRIAEGFNEAEVLEAVYAIETQSSHPLAQAITAYAESRGVNQSGYISIEETSGFGVMAEVSGAKWKVGKAGFIGEEMAAQFMKQTASDIIQSGHTIVFVKKDDQIAGCIALKDQIRPEAKEVMEELNRLGIKTAMLTGDHVDTAQVIAKEAGMTTVAAECLPDQKVNEIKRLKEEFER